MKRKKISNEETKRFSAAVKELARIRGTRADIVHTALKKRFKYKSYGWLWKRKGEILEFVREQIRKAEYKHYS